MKNMSRFSSLFACVAAILTVASCSNVANVDIQIEGLPSTEVVVKQLDLNKNTVLDTLVTDHFGKISFKVELEEGQPDFIYVFKGDEKLVSLLLQSGDNVSVKADASGNYTVTGSPESEKLAQVEKDYAAAVTKMETLAASLDGASSQEAEAIRKSVTSEYVSYYRSRVRYVMENSKSLTVIPVFYQVLGGNLSVFGQPTDAIHFMNVSDSLATVYPDSKYVKALRKQAEARKGQMELMARLESADEIGFPDISLPDIKGEKVRLSDLDAKVIMVQFWTATEAAQKMLNIDVLKPLYEEFHKKGFEIYQVALDPDKTLWASVVREQKLPWISVCDGLGAKSPYMLLYNLPGLPATYIISNGELVDGQIVDEKSLRNIIKKLL